MEILKIIGVQKCQFLAKSEKNKVYMPNVQET